MNYFYQEDEKKKHKEKSMFGMKVNEPEFTGKDKKAIRDFQGENAKVGKCSPFFWLAGLYNEI